MQIGPGIQIGLLIGRNDQVIHICELKFLKGAVSLTKADAENLRNKVSIFIDVTNTGKQVFLTLIISFGIPPNKHSIGLVENAFTMDILFGCA